MFAVWVPAYESVMLTGDGDGRRSLSRNINLSNKTTNKTDAHTVENDAHLAMTRAINLHPT